MPRWRAVVFDLDDTLYPERDYVMSGFRAVALWADVNLGISSDKGRQELRALLERGVRGDTFDRWLVTHNRFSKARVAQLVWTYREHEPLIKPYPEVPEVLRSLKSRYLLGLVSDGYLEVQRRKLEALRLAPWFDAIVFSDEWGRKAWKPSTQPFEAILQRLGNLPGRDVVYVGDNPAKDFLAARRAGLAAVQVRRRCAVHAHMAPATPDHRPHLVIRTLRALPQALERLRVE
jgi:putative hydrolase of the HAD superfamily